MPDLFTDIYKEIPPCLDVWTSPEEKGLKRHVEKERKSSDYWSIFPPNGSENN